MRRKSTSIDSKAREELSEALAYLEVELPLSKTRKKSTSRSRQASKSTRPQSSELVARHAVMPKSLPTPPEPPTPSIPMPLIPMPTLLVKKPRRRKKHADFDEDCIKSYSELVAALKSEVVQITLGANIIAPEDIAINHDIAINLNGYSIISEESTSGAHVLDIRSGEVTLTGKGNIFAMGSRSVAVRMFGAISTEMPYYTSLTVDEGVRFFAPDSYGILISPSLGVAYGLTVNFGGTIYARDGICLASGIRGDERHLPTINIQSSANIISDEKFGSAIEAAGIGIWKIAAAKLSGASGITARAGTIELSHTEVITTGHAPHATFRLEPSELATLNLAIDGGAYVSEHSSAIAGDASALKNFVIKGGDFCAPAHVIERSLKKHLHIEDDASFGTDVAHFLERLHPKIELLPEPEPEPDPQAIAVPATTPQDPKPETGLPPALPASAKAREAEPEPELTSVPPLDPNLPPAEIERLSTKAALLDAVIDIRKLKAEDYDVGYAHLQDVLTRIELVLFDDNVALAEIRDAAADLLEAFEGLEERNELSLSDAELDQLFYHGAILQEFASEATSSPAQEPSSEPDQVSAPSETPVTNPVTTITEPSPLPQATTSYPVPTPLPPQETPTLDWSLLREAIDVIYPLDLTKYSISSYNHVLDQLDQAKLLLLRPDAPQSAVDEVCFKIVAALAHLEPATENPALAFAESLWSADESTPNPLWSTGTIFAIDELSPNTFASRPLRRPWYSFLPQFLRKFFHPSYAC